MPVLTSLNIHRHDRGTRATITLAGELDLETAHSVRAVIEDCLGDGIRTVDIDLTLLTFCDVSGLNAFLVASQRTTTVGGTLCLRHPSPMLTRLLELTVTGFLLDDRPLVSASCAAAADGLGRRASHIAGLVTGPESMAKSPLDAGGPGKVVVGDQ